MYTYIYIYTYLYIYIYIYIYIHTCVHTRTHTSMSFVGAARVLADAQARALLDEVAEVGDLHLRVADHIMYDHLCMCVYIYIYIHVL